MINLVGRSDSEGLIDRSRAPAFIKAPTLLAHHKIRYHERYPDHPTAPSGHRGTNNNPKKFFVDIRRNFAGLLTVIVPR
jgi:hypothetical protein